MLCCWERRVRSIFVGHFAGFYSRLFKACSPLYATKVVLTPCSGYSFQMRARQPHFYTRPGQPLDGDWYQNQLLSQVGLQPWTFGLPVYRLIRRSHSPDNCKYLDVKIGLVSDKLPHQQTNQQPKEYPTKAEHERRSQQRASKDALHADTATTFDKEGD